MLRRRDFGSEHGPRVPAPRDTRTAAALIVAGSAAAILWFGARGHILWPLSFGMAVCHVAGALCGTRLAASHGSARVRQVFIVIVALLILKTAWDALP